MKKHVIVGTFVRIESFKSMSMPIFTQNRHRGKVGDYLQARKYTGESSSCSTSARFFQQRAKMVKHASNSIVAQLAPIWWRHQKVKLLIPLTKETWQGLSIIRVNQTASLKSGMFLDKFASVFFLWKTSNKTKNLTLTINLMFTVHLSLNVSVGPNVVKAILD